MFCASSAATRILAGGRQPRQEVGHGEPDVVRPDFRELPHDLLQPDDACEVLTECAKGGLGRGRLQQGCHHGLERQVEPAAVSQRLRRVPEAVAEQTQQSRPLPVRTLEGIPLVLKQGPGEASICDRVIYGLPGQLVALDQVMIGIARKCQRRQIQRVDPGQPMDGRIRRALREHAHVVEDQVVAQDGDRSRGGPLDRVLVTRQAGPRIPVAARSALPGQLPS